MGLHGLGLLRRKHQLHEPRILGSHSLRLLWLPLLDAEAASGPTSLGDLDLLGELRKSSHLG